MLSISGVRPLELWLWGKEKFLAGEKRGREKGRRGRKERGRERREREGRKEERSFT